jgi:hypothetical protein
MTKVHAAPMTGLKPRVRQKRSTSESNPDSQTEVHNYGFNTRPASPAAPSPRTEVHPIRPWESDSISGVPEISVDGSGITPGLSYHGSIQTPNDWTPAGLIRSGQGPFSGYLGSTSFSAIFDEKIDIVAAGESNAISDTHVECLSSQEHNVKIKEGAAVLAQLADFKHFKALVERWLEYGQDLALVSADAPYSPPSSSTAFAVVIIAATWLLLMLVLPLVLMLPLVLLASALASASLTLSQMGPFTQPCLDAVERDVVSKKLGSRGLLAISEKILDNSTRPVKVPSNCKFSDYHLLFTGENMRWEHLALLFTAAGLSAIVLGPTDPLLSFVGQVAADKQEFVHRMVRLGSSCLGFCTDVGHLNDLGVWILHEHCILVSQILGDAHYLTWRRFGDLASALFATGLHQEIKESPDVPFWLTEFRRRSVGVIYGIDKMMSVFLGRPPRISQRYCSITNPLDLDFEDFAEDGPELAEKLALIDKVTGWNADGVMRKSTHTRCFVIINRIREDILELSLGRSVEDVSAISADIARRNEEAWNGFPKSHKYYPEIWTGKRSADECVTTVFIYLDVVYNEFLLQRTLVRRVRAPSEALVRISRLLLSTCIAVVNNRSHLGTVGCDAGWIAVLYGLPSSGVLALELLQQTQNRASTTKDFPRSEVIQNLSVFVACLSWVHLEGDGNYHLCIQARNMIQRILDRVLSPEATYSSHQPFPTPSSTGDFADEPMYDFSWMDSAQFDADFWSNLDFHPLLAIPES